jgi:hypothetical protein
MKLLLSAILSILSLSTAFAQEMQNIEVRSFEYVWERQSDNRVVFAKDSIFQEVLKRSFIKAFEEKWSVAPVFDVTVNKLSAFRLQPKFNTSLSNADTAKSYVFLQLFDRSIPGNPNNMLFSARIDARYRVVKSGVTLEDNSVSFKIMRQSPPFGGIAIKRYPFHPSQFKLLCDTVATTILNDKTQNEKEIWLSPACAYTEETIHNNPDSATFQFVDGRRSIAVTGGNPFSIILDSVNEIKVGRKLHAAANTAAGLLTLFSNIDSEKKRSTLYVADHSFNDGSATYHAYISYVATKIAERRRVKDDDGLKSIEVGEYQPAWKQINPRAIHVITMNGDTVSSFNIEFRVEEDHFNKIWDGHDSSTVDNMPPAFNNIPRSEMAMKGKIEDTPFVLTTSGEGQIKKIMFNGEEVFYFYSNTTPHGLLTYRNMDERHLKVLTLISLLSDKYFTYN